MFIPRRYRTCTPERLGEIAAKTVVQLLFTTGKSFTVDGLREKLGEFFREGVRAEVRAVAALNNVELITALICCNRQLGLVAFSCGSSTGWFRSSLQRSTTRRSPHI